MPKNVLENFAVLRRKLSDIDARIASVNMECQKHGMKTEIEKDELRELYNARKRVLREMRDVAIRYNVSIA